jgi:glycosyltransferase involved in cell wall biosynthesis
MTDFSIIIPCFNAAATLRETLASIQAQTFGGWEVICVDDGSTDATLELLHQASAADPRIKVIRNSGKGPSRARNLGALSFAHAQIIAFCDADDIWGPDKLAQLRACFADSTVDAAFGKVAFFNHDPAQATVFSTVPDTQLSVAMLLGENPVCTMSNIAVRKEAFIRSCGFDEGMVHNEDLDWLIRLVGGGAHVVGIDACQTWYRSNQYGLSADLDAMRRGRAGALRSAARLGHETTARAEAIFMRYLSRRALRLGQGRWLPLSLAVRGICHSPAGFLSPIRRGGATLSAAAIVPFLPRALARTLFSR